MNCGSVNACLVKLFYQAVCTVFGACKDNTSGHIFFLDDVNDESALVRFPYKHNLLSDSLYGNFFWTDIHHHSLVEE